MLHVGAFNTAVTSLLATSIASLSTILLNVHGEEVPKYKPIFLHFKILELHHVICELNRITYSNNLWEYIAIE